ncbi:hypothetical protein EDEG_00258 [Edhazardia aedis USNM 41457]|uniref:PWWP domain-containing protein n=1 Tax=Edhazardia aedis (strain USNM 41457) TaxID=1003232 RepID=J9D4R5_EDHAE|nr:hypothetical protein EDEG_00258 [Edhazardia aedis USNM 41457]|eukprot:EJW02801.1 hypothetical protein EDEG_00258 [Edhazardia aedis USNM 41457]
MQDKKCYIDQIVWSQFDQYPYWPSRLADKEQTRNLREYYHREDGTGVLFLGKKQEWGLVDNEKIKPFKKFYKEFCTAEDSEEFKLAIKQAEDFIAQAESGDFTMFHNYPEMELDVSRKRRKKSVRKSMSKSRSFDRSQELNEKRMSMKVQNEPASIDNSTVVETSSAVNASLQEEEKPKVSMNNEKINVEQSDELNKDVIVPSVSQATPSGEVSNNELTVEEKSEIRTEINAPIETESSLQSNINATETITDSSPQTNINASEVEKESSPQSNINATIENVSRADISPEIKKEEAEKIINVEATTEEAVVSPTKEEVPLPLTPNISKENLEMSSVNFISVNSVDAENKKVEETVQIVNQQAAEERKNDEQENGVELKKIDEEITESKQGDHSIDSKENLDNNDMKNQEQS